MDARRNPTLRSGVRASVLAVALALVTGFGWTAGHTAFAQQQGQQAPLPTPADLSRTFINVARQVKPAVVHIEVENRSRRSSARSLPEGFPRIPGLPFEDMPRRQRGSGSGVIVSADGYILTNNHVAGEADEIKVKLADGREMKARRIGTDPETDLAVIKIDATDLPYARLGNSDAVEQGEWVIALGSPFGLQQTMTAGIVSAIGRDLPGAGPFTNFIQTDAAINPGNSGGPLINMNGEVIGINTLIFSRTGGSEGVGFAIPSNLTSKVYAQLVERGRVTRGYLGVLLGDVTPTIARSIGYNGEGGALVNDLAATNTPAARAGLRSGDIIIEVDGKPVKSSRNLTEIVSDLPVGKAVPVKYVRDGQVQTTTVTLAERPGQDELARQQQEPEENPATGKLGVYVSQVTPEMARQMSLKVETGVMIQRVQPDSPADEAGLQAGDVIHRVNRMPIRSERDLVAALAALKDEKEMVLQISRRGQLTFVTVTLE